MSKISVSPKISGYWDIFLVDLYLCSVFFYFTFMGTCTLVYVLEHVSFSSRSILIQLYHELIV